GGSELPDIPAEFTQLIGEEDKITVIGRSDLAPQVGFVDAFPVAAQDEMVRLARADGKIKMWPRHCPGVASMARADSPNSANSQFFLMFGDSRRGLDKSYTAWGWVVDGMEHVLNIAPGEPPSRPDQIQSMRVAADVDPAERASLQVMKTDSEAFADYLDALGVGENGLIEDVCSVSVPVRKTPS
ncbi:MAG: peptidylprolyl isomerase, partial [Pseudomonadota bacterium]